MNFLKQHKQRWELLLMMLLGVTCGSCLSRLLQLVRREFNTASTSLGSASPFIISSGGNSTTTDTLYSTGFGPQNKNSTLRILCVVTGRPKAEVHIERTWGKRCHRLLFMSGKRKASVSFTDLLKKRHSSSTSSGWGLLRDHLHYVYTHYNGQYDWVLMVTDECYVVMENLQHFLNIHAPDKPIYFDSFTNGPTEKFLRSGSAGYVFSREALYRFATLAHDNSSICSEHSYGIKHLEMARCLQNVGVAARNTYDEHGLPRFVNKQSNITEGCCSKATISFPCVNLYCFYMMEYIIYRLRPFGIS